MKSHFLRNTLFAITLFCASVGLALPWGLYYYGLHALTSLPQPATTLLSQEQQAAQWAQAGFQIPAEEVQLNPVSYLFSATGQDAPPAVTSFAWRIASAHLSRQLPQAGVWQKTLCGSALTIWITRHWSQAQIVSTAAQLDTKRP
ncbi:hypothetical protein [Undibacterium curvum]|uniref:Uncharacterized protein n=1 Tax=Undibacterium curvum TaxID=2762294 RepID=A0ABR7A4R9_9BURK|nr:hypothetical protein [Undibacterium curvum]MBC3931904.1 hypothetical protein [Undibacterium curvum]